MGKRVISAILSLQDRDFSSNLRRASERTDDFGRGVTRVGNQVQRFSQSATRALKVVGASTAALGVAGLAAFSSGIAGTVIEMDSAFSRLEARTGTTGAELAALEGVAKDVFTSGFGESITQASDNVATLSAMFHDLGNEDLTNVVKGASTIAETWDYEAKEVGKAVQAMTNNFDNLGENKALDLMTFAFQKTGDYSDDLLDTFSEYSMHFSKLGLGAEEFTGILIRGAENGAFNLDFVADGVKELGIRVIDESKTTAEGFEAIGFGAEEMANKFAAGGEEANTAFQATIAGLAAMKNPIERNAAGVALFGTKWGDLREDVILSMADSSAAVEGFEGSTGRAADALHNNFKSKMIKSWRDLQVGISDVVNGAGAQEFLNTLANKSDELVPKIQGVVEKAFEFGNTIRDNWGPIKETVIGASTAIGVLVVGMGALKVVSTVTTLVQGFRTALALATAGQWAMNTALLASPFTWIVIGIAAVVAAGVTLYRNSEQFREGWDTAWNGIKSATETGVNFVIDKINKMIGLINNIPGIEIPDIPTVDFTPTEKRGTSNAIAPQMIDKSYGLENKQVTGIDKSYGLVQGSYAIGANRISHDQTANIHKDEMIIPARQAERVRAAGGNIDNIDQLIQAQPSITTNTVTNNNPVSGKGPISIVIENIHAKGVTVGEVINELVPLLKLHLSNI